MKSVFLLLFAFGTLLYAEPVYVYRTFESYEKDSAEVHEEYRGWMQSMGRTFIYTKKSGKKTSFKCKDVWGFKFYGHLFRIDRRWNIPVKLVNCDTICSYENGFIWLSIAGGNKKFEDYTDFLWASDLFPYRDLYATSDGINGKITSPGWED